MKIGATTKISDPQMMAWDTEWWNVRTGRAEHLDGLSQWAIDNSVGLVYLLIDCVDTEQLHRAEDQGFRVMDTRVTLSRPTAPRAALARLARADDVNRLRDIALTAFRHTRFYADQRFNRDAVGALYSEWTRAACAGAADAVLVVDRDTVPVGYITVHLDPARIGLVAVADDFRGLGLGSELVHAAIDFCHVHAGDRIEVATQAANIGALRTFESCGFRVYSSAYWLHRWYNSPPLPPVRHEPGKP